MISIPITHMGSSLNTRNFEGSIIKFEEPTFSFYFPEHSERLNFLKNLISWFHEVIDFPDHLEKVLFEYLDQKVIFLPPGNEGLITLSNANSIIEDLLYTLSLDGMLPTTPK